MARHLLLGTALQTGLTAISMLAVLPAAAQPAPNAHPAGGAVVAGAAAISQTPSNTQITQSTQRAAIDWKSFDVGSQQSVTFSQPSASAVALNRVTGPDPSQIAGRIDANGQIILVNQSGVNFYKGAQVNAAGVMVSTIGASDQSVKSFVASASGRLALDQPGNPNAKVDNQGSITIKQAGLAALVAPQVANSGTITAKLGHVVLAGAKTATLDLYGDGLLSLDVTNQVAQTPVDKNNTSVTALVTNTGVIIADGGTVQLTARAADGIVQTLVQAGGTIRVATMGSHTGTVALNGVGGSIVVEGQLSAPGNAPGTSGGAIVANATGTVTLTPTAMLNASGRAGGGTVAVGTTLARAKGGPGVTPTLTAANVVVQKGATIAADATGKGTGGRVTVLSAGTTTLAAAISAKGGPAGGDGGFVETSGHTLTLGSSATVDTRAPHGLTGLWLLDPTDWNIAITGGNETPAQVVTGLRTSNVTITADNDVTVTDAINATTDALATNSLIFQAGRSILVNASITMNGGNFTATANDSADLGTALNRRFGPGDFTMAGGVTIDTSVAGKSIAVAVGPSVANTNDGANFDPGTMTVVNLTTGGGGVTASGSAGLTLTGNVDAGAGTVTLAPAGPISQTAGGITAAVLTGSATGTVDLSPGTNAIAALGGFAVTNGGFSLANTVPLSVTGAVSVGPGFGSITISDSAPLAVSGSISGSEIRLTGSGITVSGPVTASDGLELNATNGAITEGPGGSIVANLFTASTMGTGGDVLLTSHTNLIAESTGITATNGNVVLVNSQDLILTGSYNGNNLFFEVATTDGTLQLGRLQFDDTSSAAAALTAAAGGRVTLVADNYSVVPTADFDAGPSSITVPGGTLELAPHSNIDMSTNQLIASGLFPITNVTTPQLNTLVIGGFTDVPNGATTATPSAANVMIDGPFDFATIGATPGLKFATTLNLEATGAISQSAPITNLGTLIGTADSATLTNPGNKIGTLGAFSTKSGFALVDSRALVVTGPVSDTGTTSTLALTTNAGNLTIAGTVSATNLVNLTSNGGITETGALIAGTLIGSAVGPANLTGANQIAVLGDFSADGFALSDTTSLTIAGLVAAGPSASLVVGGSLTETGGLNAGVLSGSADGSAMLTGNNIIGIVGDFTAGTNLALNDAASLNIAGSVVAGSSATFTVAGSLSETGSLTTNVLSGSAIGSASLTGSNSIAELNGFNVSGASSSFALTDAVNLLITGTMSAARITVLDLSSQISLGDGAFILTGGTTRPPGPLQPALEPSHGAPGALLQAVSFTQIGNSTVAGQGGGPATLQISTTGRDQFDPPLGLQATGTWLILDLANGTAAGNVFVNALDVSYTAPGRTDLFGTIGGVVGGRAASVGFIRPAINTNYLFNGCVIAAAECTTTSLNTGLTATLGAIYPLVSITPPVLTNLPDLVLVALPMLQPQPPQLTDPDVVPPNITYLDY